MISIKKYFLIVFFLLGISCNGQDKLSVLTFNIWDPSDVPFWESYGGYPVDYIVKYLSEDNADVLFRGLKVKQAGVLKENPKPLSDHSAVWALFEL